MEVWSDDDDDADESVWRCYVSILCVSVLVPP